MEKRIWSKPEMHEFAFAANEYVATSCGDGKKYNFVCTAERGDLFYWKKQEWKGIFNGGFVNTDWTNNDGIVDGKVDPNKVGKASHLGGYKPCKETHEAPVTDEFYDGFVDRNNNDKIDDGEGVIVWLERYLGAITNWHATDNLDMRTWTTSKS